MSHRDDCPTRWEAERRGERDQECGRSRASNPFDDPWHRGEGCHEAADSWRSGYRRAEMREEEAAHQRAIRRRMEADEEAAYYDLCRMEEQREYPEQEYPGQDEPKQ